MSSRPMRSGERLESLDVLRGLAVLGILMVNAAMAAAPWPVAYNPMASSFPFEGASVVLWWTMHTLFEFKFITLFSLLFGVSVFLTGGEPGERPGGAVLRRRLAWLLLFGAVHGALIWWGDILFHYALVGLVMAACRGWGPRRLALVGLLLFAVGALLVGAQRAWLLTPPELQLWRPTPGETRALVAEFRGDALEVTSANLSLWWRSAVIQAQLFSWRTLGVMMWGLALYKAGLFHGRGGPRLYAALTAAGLAALAVIGWRAGVRLDQGFPQPAPFERGLSANFLLSPVVTLGYVGAVLWALRADWFRPVARGLAPVGRMAFTNYVTQTVILTSLFYGGRGLGLHGRLDWPQWTLAVFAIWALQIAGSRLWLARFRMGPLEWLWRRLSYARPVPLRGGAL